MTEPSLGRRIATGGIVLVMLRLSLRLIGLVSIVVLFRVLDASDFGITALASLVVGFIEVFAEFGFDQSLLRNLDARRKDYDLIWSLNLLRGLTVALLLAASAPFAAVFLEEPRLRAVIFVLAIASLLDGLQNVGTIDFSKNLEFQKEFRLKVSQKLISFCVTLLAAFLLHNYWALVIGTLAGRLAGLVLGYVMHPYRPRWTLEGWRGVMRFSLWILTNNVVLYVGNQTDKVLVQRAFNVHVVGIVRVAEEISGMVMEFVWPVEKALYSGYVKVASNLDELKRTLLTSVGVVSMVGVPISLGLGALAGPSIALVLGAKGAAAVVFVQVYVIHGAIRSCLCGAFPIFMVLGRADIMTRITFTTVIVRLSVLFVGFETLGLAAVPWSMVASTSTAFMLTWWQVTRLLGLPVWALPAAIWRPVTASVVMAGIGHLVVQGLPAGWPSVATLVVAIPACAASFLGCLLLLWVASGRPDGAERSVLDTARGAYARFRFARLRPS